MPSDCLFSARSFSVQAQQSKCACCVLGAVVVVWGFILCGAPWTGIIVPISQIRKLSFSQGKSLVRRHLAAQSQGLYSNLRSPLFLFSQEVSFCYKCLFVYFLWNQASEQRWIYQEANEDEASGPLTLCSHAQVFQSSLQK